MLGDFNCLAGDSVPFTTLTANTGLVDTWTTAKTSLPHPTPNTFHGYQPEKPDGRRIDWVLVNESAKVESAEIFMTQINGQYPSDHFPVTAIVHFD